jgi:hypothetical protein
MSAEQPRNSFRASVLRGEKVPLVVIDKAPRRGRSKDTIDAELVARSEPRRANHRGKDRHRLISERATAFHRGKRHKVELVNLSAGGAMIRGAFKPRLWDMLELELADGPRFEGAVRWIKDDQVGIEFAHETLIDCDPKKRAEVLLEVIQRSFPDQKVSLEHEHEGEIVEQPEEDLGNRGEKRHPLIWKGEIHYAFDSNPVRLRNVSAGGALLDVMTFYPVGAEIMLDLGGAGQFEAVVTWGHEDQVGVKFKQPFAIECLANARPEVTPQSWNVPDFLDRAADEDDTPWSSNWSRSSIAEFREDLEGFLKR